MSNGSIDLKNITLAFGEGRDSVTALENLTLAVRPGELLSVLGPSGCGKSSLISAIAGFLPPRFGALRVDGEPGANRVPTVVSCFSSRRCFLGKQSGKTWNSDSSFVVCHARSAAPSWT